MGTPMNAGYVYYWNFSASVEVGTYGEGPLIQLWMDI